MKHSLVTGGAGFIGSHLAEALLARGDRVTVVDDESTGTRENLTAILDHPRFDYVRGSVADGALVEQVVAGADEVFHLAAAVGVGLIADDPIRSIETNIVPSTLILDALGRRHQEGARVKFFLASTSEIYGRNATSTWTEREEMVFGQTDLPRWSYGVSKAIDEFLALAWWRKHGLPVVVGRFFNVVGPRQTGAYGMVLPRFIEAAVSGGPLVVHDDGLQVRCFAHVADVVGAVVALMETPRAIGLPINIGSDRPISILELARRVVQIVDPSVKIEFQSYAAAYGEDFEDCRRRVPDLSRLGRLIDFKPRHGLDDVIRELVALERRKP